MLDMFPHFITGRRMRHILCLLKLQAIKVYGGVKLKLHSFLTAALINKWPSRLGRF